MGLTFLIVDDEQLSRDYIYDLISEFQPEAIISEASSAVGALSVIAKVKPDVLFLDIKMPEVDGFSFLEKLSYRDFELVFITAYSSYALMAFKEGAADYLLKPIKKSDFKTTLAKVSLRRIHELERRKNSPAGRFDKYLYDDLVINLQSGIKNVKIKNIIYLKAENTYTTFYLESGENIVTSKPIKHFENNLQPELFFRIHKSHIISLYHLKEYIAKTSGTRQVLMSNGTKLLISKYRLSEFLKRIKNAGN